MAERYIALDFDTATWRKVLVTLPGNPDRVEGSHDKTRNFVSVRVLYGSVSDLPKAAFDLLTTWPWFEAVTAECETFGRQHPVPYLVVWLSFEDAEAADLIARLVQAAPGTCSP